MEDLLLTESPLDVNAAFAFVTEPGTGATSIFVGTTRDNFEGKKVVKLEYEAYESMALKELNKLCTSVRENFSVNKILVHHRLGEVKVTEASVIIAISSPRRKEALQAVSYAIDKLKATVPIWKKEIYEDGTGQWKENKECCCAKEQVNGGHHQDHHLASN